nr:ribonuclease T [uncultured Cohaesibacter sp.]
MKTASRPRQTPQPLTTSVNRAVFVTLTILLLLSLTAPVRQASADEAGDFDYYILTLSWSPTYCADEARRNRDQLQCFSERSFGFVIHGLWPQYERGYPERCRTRFRDPSDNLVEQMLKFSPSESLIRHEWDKHGSCSGLVPLDYFRLAVRSFKALKRPDQLADLERPLLMTVPQIESAFHDANPELPEDSLFVTCKRQKLSEVRLCLDKEGKPRQCSPSAIRARCGSRDKLRILAVR